MIPKAFVFLLLSWVFCWSLALGNYAHHQPEHFLDLPGEDGLHNIRIAPDGALFAIGVTSTSEGGRDIALWKMNEEFQLDPTFGDQGLVRLGSTGDDQGVDVIFEGREVWILGQVGAGDGDFVDQGYAGGMDLCLIRLDEEGDLLPSPRGITLWGGAEDDEFIVHLHNYSEPGDRYAQADDGYVIAAMTRSGDGPWGDKVQAGNPHKRDVLVFKIDRQGMVDPRFGMNGYFRLGTEPGIQEKQESAHDFAFSIVRNPGTGYLISGYTVGSRLVLTDGTVVPTRGNGDDQGNNDCGKGEFHCYKMDGLLIALDKSGALRPEFGSRGVTFYGGTGQEKLYDVLVDEDGSIYTVGRTSSFDLDVERPYSEFANFDGVVFKFTSTGRLDPAFGRGGHLLFSTRGDDQALRLAKADGSLWVLSHSDSHQYPFTTATRPSIYRDAFLFQVSPKGDLLKRLSLGLAGDEKPTVLLPMGDGLVVGGFSTSLSGDVKDQDKEVNRAVFLKPFSAGDLAPAPRYREINRFSAPEARQGVAVGEEAIYVVGNSIISRYAKENFTREHTWECPEGDSLIHLNDGIVEGGRLWTAHSNYPEVPMQSSLEMWSIPDLDHLGNQSFGIRWGSLTWVDFHEGSWYACFAHYGNRAAEPNRDPSWSQLVQFSEDFTFRQGFTFPASLVERFDRYSSSGGAFGPDGRLYVTGHDNPELYVLELPEFGSELVWVDVIPFPSEGQAFSFDPANPWRIYSILKRDREVIVGELRLANG